MILATLAALYLYATGPQHAAVLAAPEIVCITAAVYTEAEGEPYIGKLAVAAVVRARAERANESPCAIVFKRHQFSGLGRRVGRINLGALLESFGAARASALSTAPVPKCAGATHFDNNSNARWTRVFVRVCTIGRHTFYRSNT